MGALLNIGIIDLSKIVILMENSRNMYTVAA